MENVTHFPPQLRLVADNPAPQPSKEEVQHAMDAIFFEAEMDHQMMEFLRLYPEEAEQWIEVWAATFAESKES